MPPLEPHGMPTSTRTVGELRSAGEMLAAEEILGGRPRVETSRGARAVTIGQAPADDARHPDVVAHRALRRAVFVDEQGLFADDPSGDLDEHDRDPRAVVLVARDAAGEVLGGVRLAPVDPDPARPDLGWWTGSRLAVTPSARRRAGMRVGAALVRAACARAESAGVLRFEADVQAGNATLFTRLGWDRVRDSVVAGRPHVRMRWRVGRFAALVAATKAPLGELARRPGRVRDPISATTARPSPAATSSPPATRSCPRWSSATPNGRGGAACSSTSTTSPPWARTPSGCSTPSGRATRRSRTASWPACAPPPTPTACPCSAATPSSRCPRRSRSRPWARRATRSPPAAAASATRCA